LLLLLGSTSARAEEKPPAPPKEGATDADTAKKLKELLTQKRDTLKKVNEVLVSRFEKGLEAIGTFSGAAYVQVSKDLCMAELELCDKPADRIAAFEKYFETAKKVEDALEAQFKAGKVGEEIYLKFKAVRLEAEIDLLREKTKDKWPSKLGTERRDALKKAKEAKLLRIEKGLELMDASYFQISKDLCEAELELYDKPGDRIAALEKHLEIAKKVEDVLEAYVKAGKIREDDFLKVKTERLKAESQLQREKTKDKSPSK
jgi:hypothetical protein